MRNVILARVLPLLVCLNVRGQDAVRPGRFVVEPPTLICLGFEWEISGADNRNASVEVEYREAGSRQWNEAMPLLRIGGDGCLTSTTISPAKPRTRGAYELGKPIPVYGPRSRSGGASRR